MGSIKTWNITIPQLSGSMQRRAYLYLPGAYFTDPVKCFPVMYMFDGHNVFYDSHATFGKSWGMKEYLDRTNKDLIIAAVGCNPVGNCRLEEYSPFDFEFASVGKIKGRGKAYMDWLVGTFKPYIDKNFRTLQDRSNTLICGSSMGGLMALYGAAAYNQIFRRAACLSPSLWTDPDSIQSILAVSEISPDTCIYLDYGSEEMANHDSIMQELLAVSESLLRQQVKVTLRIVPDGTHSEASWERQIPVFMECLGV